MFKIHLFISIILSPLFSFSQELVFVELGSDFAYCRLFAYQSGNGTVYAAAEGGTPDYTYLWTDLQTGATTSSTVWGGLNPGKYEIKVEDGIGDVLVDTVTVDSINPIADFEVISDNMVPVIWGYIGNSPATAEFINTSVNVVSPGPWMDAHFLFRPQGFETWVLYDDFEIPDYTYEYGGVYTASLIAMNKNGCVDTAHATISLSGPLALTENDQTGSLKITSHSISNSVTIKKAGFEEGLLINFYCLSGKLIRSEMIMDTETNLQLSQPAGIYIYKVIDPISQRFIQSGKLTFN